MQRVVLTEMGSQCSNVSSISSTSDTSSCSSNEEEHSPMKLPSLLHLNDNDHDDNDNLSLRKTVSDARFRTTLPSSRGSVMTEWFVIIGRWIAFVTFGVLLAVGVSAFSIQVPFFLAPWAAHQTYRPAFYHYDPVYSFFDNTAWTYGTDYGLAVVMSSLGIWLVCSLSSSPSTRTLRWLSACLLWSYAISVTAGGIAHQFYFTAEERNSIGFRALWSICVGSVTAASGWMGCIATELLHQSITDERMSSSVCPPIIRSSKSYFGFGPHSSWTVPIISRRAWVGYGVGATVTCLLGYMSFQRPACDIFVAGTTQFVSSFYMMSVVGWSYRNHPFIRWSYRVMSVLSWILNAPLLPLYPLLIQYTNWSLAKVNTFLHCWLLVAWGLQGIALQHYAQALHKACSKPTKAIPLKIPSQQQPLLAVEDKKER